MAAVLLLLTACSGGSKRGWKGYGEEADRLVLQLDSINQARGVAAADTVFIGRMARVAKNPDDNNLRAMVCYWKACAMRVCKPDSAGELIVLAEKLCDSARAPYLNARIRLAAVSNKNADLHNRYISLRNLLDYSKSIRDTSMMISVYHLLGAFYLSINDLEGYRECSEENGRIYEHTGNHTSAAKNRMNFALYHMLKGDSAVAAGIIRSLLRNPYVSKDSVFMGRLFINIGNLLHDPDSMARAIEISSEFRNDVSKRYTIEFSIANMLDERGDIERCDSMLSYLSSVVLEYGDYEAKKKLYLIKSKRCKAVGDVRGALIALEKGFDYADSIEEKERSSGIYDYIHRDKMKRIDQEYERQKFATRMRWISLSLICSLVVILILFWLWDKHRKSQIARTKAERDLARTSLSLEREKRSLVAMGLAMTERDNLVKDVGKAIDAMSREGRISSDDKRSMSRMIKLSDSSQQECANFKDAYEKVHPDFLKRLSERYPDLSEGDVRLALYISVGLSSAQIAQVMHIKIDSVKKNRQRLRRHMAIDQSESLEDTLRGML